MTVEYLTKEGYNTLKEELDYLRTVKRQEVSQRLHEALEGGDAGIDADAECEAAKNEQAFVEGRIYDLENLLSNAVLIDENNRLKGIVTIGSKVTIKEKYNGEEVYTIIGAAETNPRKRMISNESPLGKALLNRKVGEVVDVKAPNGGFKVKIIRVE